MRRFLIVCVALLLLYFLGDTLVYRTDLVLPWAGDEEPYVLAKRLGKDIIMQDKDGKWPVFIPRGINLPTSIPGESRRDDAIDCDHWLRWLEQIQELGVNCVRVQTIACASFYEALYTFNTTRETPLYLWQGVWVEDGTIRSAQTAYDRLFRDRFITDARMAVDVVHGRRKIPENNRYGHGAYTWDVSPWTLGYILGVPWDADMVAYTDHLRDNIGGYAGEYLYTKPEATPFESLLAEVGDKLLAYETQKYAQQKLVSFAGDVYTDPLEHADLYSGDRFGVATVDMEHIAATERVQSGLFAAYHVYPWSAGFLSREDSPYVYDYAGVGAYRGYLIALNEYHELPVVIAEYGYPSSRGLAGFVATSPWNQGNLSETQQGEGIVALYEDIMAAGCAGSMLAAWQDEWNRGAWNTMFSVDRTRAAFWNDQETADQHFGLLAFDPGEEKSVCYVDGDASEWSDCPPLADQDGLTVRARYDESYLYLCIQTEEGMVTAGRPMTVALDTTPNSGAYAVQDTEHTFERGVDFLVTLRGRQGSDMRVHAYYEQLRANWWREAYDDDGYEIPPAKDTTEFRPVYLLANPVSKYLDSRLGYADAQLFEAGRLTHGNANPASEGFNSLADYCISGNTIELRLPWQMLNFYDPTVMTIHDDYFAHYGVQDMPIDALYISVLHGEAETGFMTLPLEGWEETPTWHERIKASYAIVQAAFARDEINEGW